ncbi:DUF3450 family protein [Desulfatitalea tepidiphila]|uniref:DUF3450 family protein n=1 Tax=Desulfatitalea tepidiphila TaxID=1185843 RepID=UPI0006B5F50F
MRSSKILISWILAFLLWLGSHTAVGSDEVTERIEKPVRNAITTRQTTQAEEEQWRAERDQLMARYEALEQTIAQLETHRTALQQSNQDTRGRIAAKAQQLADIEQIGAGIRPPGRRGHRPTADLRGLGAPIPARRTPGAHRTAVATVR